MKQHHLNLVSIKTESDDDDDFDKKSTGSDTYSSRHESISSNPTSNSSNSPKDHNLSSPPKILKSESMDKSIDSIEKSMESHTASKKNRISHNKIEKKYRTNINTKFFELKNSVPTLRVLDNDQEIDFDELEGLTPASRLNKANILSKATEYIKHLEIKNKSLISEIRLLRANPNYNYNPLNTIQENHLPIEVINHLPNQPQYSHVILPNNNQSRDSFQHNQDSGASLDQNFPAYHNSIEKKHSYGYRSQMPSNDNYGYDQYNAQYNSSQYQYHSAESNLQQTSSTSHSYLNTSPSDSLNTTINSASDNVHYYSNELWHDNQQRTRSLPRTIMVGGIAALVGSNMLDSFNNGNSFKALNATPIPFIFSKSIHFLQLVTFFSCVYFFVNPLFPNFISWKKKLDKTNSNSCIFLASLLYFIDLLSLTSIPSTALSSSSTTLTSTSSSSSTTGTTSSSYSHSDSEAYPLDLTSFPNSLYGILIFYFKILNIEDCSNFKSLGTPNLNLTTPIEHTFNKIIILNLMLCRLPIIGYLFGFKSRIEFLTNSLLTLSKNRTDDTLVHSKIIEFIQFAPNFMNSASLNNQLNEILYSLNKTKSGKETAELLYGSDSKKAGCGYNSVHEYLFNTPTNKLNLFELTTVLWGVEIVRARMVKFLADVVNEETNERNELFQNDVKILINDINKVENFIPITCIKLIKCCKIFKCLLAPKNERYLNDALKLILLSVEENLTKIKNSDNNDNSQKLVSSLLTKLHSSIPVLPKVLEIIKEIQNNVNENTSNRYIFLLSDENRLSLLCSIILHQYANKKFRYGKSLIKYLKNEKNRRFMCSDSISLMASIATFRTLVVVLDHENNKGGNVNNNDNNMLDFDLDSLDDLYDDLSDSSDSSALEKDYNTKQNNNDNNTVNALDSKSESKLESELNSKDNHILEDLLCGLRIYAGQGSDNNCSSSNESADYDILSVHYGLQSELSHRLLELAKQLVGYAE